MIGLEALGIRIRLALMACRLLQRLHELGWIEGRTIAVNVQWADGRDKRYAEIATEFGTSRSMLSSRLEARFRRR